MDALGTRCPPMLTPQLPTPLTAGCRLLPTRFFQPRPPGLLPLQAGLGAGHPGLRGGRRRHEGAQGGAGRGAAGHDAAANGAPPGPSTSHPIQTPCPQPCVPSPPTQPNPTQPNTTQHNQVGGIRRVIVPVELGYPEGDFRKAGPRPTTFAVGGKGGGADPAVQHPAVRRRFRGARRAGGLPSPPPSCALRAAPAAPGRARRQARARSSDARPRKGPNPQTPSPKPGRGQTVKRSNDQTVKRSNPQPPQGERALDFVLSNRGMIDKTLLFGGCGLGGPGGGGSPCGGERGRLGSAGAGGLPWEGLGWAVTRRVRGCYRLRAQPNLWSSRPCRPRCLRFPLPPHPKTARRGAAACAGVGPPARAGRRREPAGRPIPPLPALSCTAAAPAHLNAPPWRLPL
jgi:hypothetical protein